MARRPEKISRGKIRRDPAPLRSTGYSANFWWYASGAALVAFGFADYALIAFHFAKSHAVPQAAIPIVYAFGMLAGTRRLSLLRNAVL